MLFQIFPDPRLVAAIVDRITFNAHILENRDRVQPVTHIEDHDTTTEAG